MSTVLLGTDNNFIVKHTSPNIDTVVYNGSDHTQASNAIGGLVAAFNDPQKLFASQNFGDPTKFLSSMDGGTTWSLLNTTIPSGFGNINPVWMDGAYNWNMDEDGHIWGIATQISTGHRYAFKSTDNTATSWSSIFDISAVQAGVGGGLMYISDGYIWLANGFSGTPTLFRTDLTGGNPASFTIPHVMTSVFNGWPRSNRLVLSYWAQTGTTRNIVSIDITNPASPVFTITGGNVFGANQLQWQVQPLTNQILIANAIDDTSPNPDLRGSIWRSTDGGATWVNVVSNTTNLGDAATLGGANFNNEISSIAVNPTDPTEVWVATCPPYLYHSIDSGATWTVETVDMTVFDPLLAGGVRPSEWTSIAVSSSIIQSRIPVIVSLIGAT